MSSTTESFAGLDRGDARRNAWLSWIGAAVALTGAQLISPSLPVLQEEFGLNESQLAMVMGVYLLPAAIASIPVGMLADRVGRKVVYGSAALLFGFCGIALVMTTSYGLFLVFRFFQGLALGSILPITMTILGDAFNGVELIGAQGARSVAMSIGDGVLPMVGGLLAGLAWYAPWLGQLLAIPLGILVFATMEDSPSVKAARREKRPSLSVLLRLFKSLPILSLQYAGFLRMFLKFSILTFFPVFLVDIRGQSTAFAGLVIGIAALSGTAIAAFSGRLAGWGRPSSWVVGGVVGMGTSLIAIVSLPWSWAILAVAVTYGASDGMLGVFTNSFVTAATGPDYRASFVSATAAIRNFAKFAAPVVFAGLILVLPIMTSFILLGVVTLASALIAMQMSPLETQLMGRTAVETA